VFRRVREKRKGGGESTVFQESETSQLELKPKLGYKLLAEAYLYKLH
jgi:hypothetical protein